jgi:cobalt-zinc-cadmium efflux system outer membrane protein
MKHVMKSYVLASAVLCTCVLALGVAQAQQPTPIASATSSAVASATLGSTSSSTATSQLVPYLPAEATVKEALLSSPLMQAARSKKEAGIARAKGIDSGTAEFTLRSTSQRRRDVAAGTQLHESMVSIERPVRFWGKRGMDADLASQTQAFADIEYADAMHEGARELMRFWFAYLRALADQKNAVTTYDLAAKMQRLTQSQLKQGEISQLDAELANAEFERITAARSVADAQLASSASAFTRRYAGMTLPMHLPAAVRLDASANLSALTETMAAMRQEFLDKNHELNMMRVDAQRLRLAADRASRDRLPDPTVGVFSGRERAGAETISGVMFSMPFPSASRFHHATALVADAQAASDKVLLAEQQLGAMFDSMWIQFQHKRAAADNLKSAAQRQALAAEKSVKAYTLGEGSLSDVLLIARLASDNLNAAERMQLEVVELLALIRLDLHQIWDFDE